MKQPGMISREEGWWGTDKHDRTPTGWAKMGAFGVQSPTVSPHPALQVTRTAADGCTMDSWTGHGAGPQPAWHATVTKSETGE